VIEVVIGIDPGTVCGWSVLRADGSRWASGVWRLKPGRHESAGMRWVKLRRSFTELLNAYREPNAAEPFARVLVAYEAVARHAGTHAAHVYGGCIACVQEICTAAGAEYVGIPVGTVKRYATGRGNANKADMVASAGERWALDCDDLDHNEADALHVAAAALQEVTGG